MPVRLGQTGLLFSESIGSLSQGEGFTTEWLNVRGQARIEGYVTTTQPLDASAVLIEWSDDPAGGSPVTRSKICPQDAGDVTPLKYVYPIDVRNLSRFVRISFTMSAFGAGLVQPQAEVYARPDSGGPPT